MSQDPQAEATHARAEALLQAFIPRMGSAYARGRNVDPGPGSYRDVSLLSPYLRRRLLLESEVVAAALAHHGLEAAEKFIQEVFWRGYFKGWLERRPSIWTRYRQGLDADLNRLNKDPELQQRLEAAETGRTGIDCFDAWARQLLETGYLHNHARMWFASIWIFTLRLPWRLGADFFYRHLLDGDPASNTLSWRWVAGLHTRGKAYQATAWNIAKFTGQGFTPREDELAAEIQSQEHEEPEGLPPVSPLRIPARPDLSRPTLLLITEEDCRLEDFDLAGLDLRGMLTLSASTLRSPRAVSAKVQAFEAQALADAAARLGLGPQGSTMNLLEIQAQRMESQISESDAPESQVFESSVSDAHSKDSRIADTSATNAQQLGHPSQLADCAKQLGATQILTPYVPEGPLRDWLRIAEPALLEHDIQLSEWRRDWDRLIWPHATAGFFKVKKQIPRILAKMEMQ